MRTRCGGTTHREPFGGGACERSGCSGWGRTRRGRAISAGRWNRTVVTTPTYPPYCASTANR
jgi:hypothetical protein